MQQVLQDNRGNLEVASLPEPLPPAQGVLVRNHFSLISPGTERAMVQVAEMSLLAKARSRPDLARQVIGKLKSEGVFSTLRKVQARLAKPVPLGYSCAGRVVVSTSALFAPHERVACAGFGYASHAELVSVPQNLCVAVPATVSDRAAATVTVGTIALQGVRVAGPQLGETVVVIGLGLIGQITTMLLVANGCRVVGMDPSVERAELARELGAQMVTTDVRAAALKAELGSRGADCVMVTAASRKNGPIELAAEICRDKGCVVVVGDVKTDLPRAPFYNKELELRFARSYGPGRYDRSYEEEGHDYPYAYVRWTEQRNMAAYLDLVGQGRIQVERLITHTFPIEDALTAYEIVAGKTEEPHLGILLSYPADAPPLKKVTLRKPAESLPGRMRIGFLGAGNFATGVLLPHLKNCSSELHTICSPRGISARAAAAQFGFAQIASDPETIMNDPDIGLVFVVTPHETHADLVMTALKAGKAVFVEKPLAVNDEELERIAKTYREYPQPLLVGFNRRFAPLTLKLREFLGERRQPLLLHYRVLAGNLPADSPWQNPAAGGRIVGELCHFIDLCFFLTGSPIVRVSAEATGAPGEPAHPHDNLQVLLKFADHSVATVTYAAAADGGPGKEELTVLGDGQTAILDNFQKLTCYAGGQVQTYRGKGDKGHATELNTLLETLKNGAPMPIPFDELYEVTKTTFAVQDALALGNSVQLGHR